MTRPRPDDSAIDDDLPAGAVSRRGFFRGAGAVGLATAVSPFALARDAGDDAADGTPEQVHLTWGQDPASTVHVSWASAAQAVHPRVRFGDSARREHVLPAVQRTYTDGLNGQTVFTYHAKLEGLRPDSLVHYAVTADNDRNAAQPFAATFRTARRGRHAFRFTSYGDLATPNTGWVLSSLQSRYAVQAVEQFQPLFHLLNGDLCYANLNPASQPAVWADFGNNIQASASQRPWMPCPGNHEVEFHNGPQGFDSYLTRFALPHDDGESGGRWYSFRVGSVFFVSLSSDDVVYQDGAAFVAGPAPLQPAASTGNAAIAPGTSFYVRGYSRGAQTRWLEETLARARRDDDIDWIVVQMHQDAITSSQTGNGADKGLREAWLPIFDRYGVDLVVCGHDHDYERSWPLRGCNHDAGRDAATGAPVDTCQPRPVATAPSHDGSFDTTHGTVHLVLGGGGTSAPLDVYGTDTANGLPQAKVFTKPNRPVPGATAGVYVRNGADALEDAIWSARRDTGTGYGIAVFDVDPGERGGKTSITIRYHHAPGADQVPTAKYELFETVALAKRGRGA
jgi:hypothetical protein